jgi:hypothetical protein
MMSKETAQKEAIRQAILKLGQVDLAARCAMLKLPPPCDGKLELRAFATDFVLDTVAFTLLNRATGTAAKDGDLILILHLLLCELPLSPSEELVPFRDFPGGMFYLEPFLSRSVRPLAKRYGNRIEELRGALARFDHELLELGDLSARIHCIGCLYVTLVYRLGDDEFPTQAELFFNAPTKRALCAEDAAVLAGRICFGLF